MELTPHLHAFLWTSMQANNCNTYLLRSSEKLILIDPGHVAYFDHVRNGLQQLSLTIEDIDLVICNPRSPGPYRGGRGVRPNQSPFYAS